MNQQDNNNQATLPRRSRRLATIIPAEHWISMGYSEDDAQLMEKLQNDIKKYCDNNGDIDIDLRGRNEFGLLPHHDLMIPHWQKLLKSLKGRTNVAFGLVDISLPASLLETVFPALQLVNIVELTLFGCRMGSEGFTLLSSFLENNSNLESLGVGADDINGYSIDQGMSVASTFSEAIKNHPTLEKVFIAACIAYNTTNILRTILEGTTTIKDLTISMHYFDSEDIAVFADFISSNNPTEVLTLNQCNITDYDTLLLASSLKTNTNLKMLYLYDNEITQDGETTLLNALYNPTSIDSIIKSNHTCYTRTHDSTRNRNSIVETNLEAEVLVVNDDRVTHCNVWEKIRRKVVLALCRVDGEIFDLSLLNDIPPQLMPRVLELIQEHTTSRSLSLEMEMETIGDQLEIDALSRLFHTLRGWELPLLFVNLNTPSANATGKRKRRKTRR